MYYLCKFGNELTVWMNIPNKFHDYMCTHILTTNQHTDYKPGQMATLYVNLHTIFKSENLNEIIEHATVEAVP
jgi:hypothetical protein